MWQSVQTNLVGVLVLRLRLDSEGIHTGIALLGGDVLGVLLPKHPLWKLPGLPFVSGTELLRLENGVLACTKNRNTRSWHSSASDHFWLPF